MMVITSAWEYFNFLLLSETTTPYGVENQNIVSVDCEFEISMNIGNVVVKVITTFW